MKILAIIPARGGSVGIPTKNIQKLAGKPLIQYTIDAAKKSKLVNRIIVSTDDKKIARIAQKLGAEVPFLRPKNISKSTSTQISFVKHAIEYLKNHESYEPDIIIILHPTQPLRTACDIDRSIRLLKKSKSDIVLGVMKIKTHPYRSFWLRNNYLKPFRKDFLKFYQRQKFPKLYFPTGYVYTFWYSTYVKYGQIYGPKITPMLLRDKDIFLDIDYPFDLFMGEMILKNWRKYQRRFTSNE
ncbi:cytidylyltransferase domain-containing protein [Candidatus Nitrosotenuis uzonensis]|uniref:Post-translational flagellin modification protein B n=1 Tax=Candidatus Nitrosotenuis uzonensis TaxID=1407055 RepID=A0A812EUC9_9ARCH|nr:acylneuraminate cytidylyltransferase family protein [Candidatus Nitrosotenuis uzonensis]CAE6487019.1 Post-translational flagellin modification protein B [Candidatus Nitrosotenuis uzonensis]